LVKISLAAGMLVAEVLYCCAAVFGGLGLGDAAAAAAAVDGLLGCFPEPAADPGAAVAAFAVVLSDGGGGGGDGGEDTRCCVVSDSGGAAPLRLKVVTA
jgi:hypothetical protein